MNSISLISKSPNSNDQLNRLVFCIQFLLYKPIDQPAKQSARQRKQKLMVHTGTRYVTNIDLSQFQILAFSELAGSVVNWSFPQWTKFLGPSSVVDRSRWQRSWTSQSAGSPLWLRSPVRNLHVHPQWWQGTRPSVQVLGLPSFFHKCFSSGCDDSYQSWQLPVCGFALAWPILQSLSQLLWGIPTRDLPWLILPP